MAKTVALCVLNMPSDNLNMNTHEIDTARGVKHNG